MEPRLTLVTLGVADLARAADFYERVLRLPRLPSPPTIAFFSLGAVRIGLYPREALAEDAGVDPGGGGFSGVTLAHNLASEAEVDRLLAEVVAGGARLVRPARRAPWGGYSAYFADPDGHLWELAYNPHAPDWLDGQPPRGRLVDLSHALVAGAESRIDLDASAGTRLVAPFDRFRDGFDLDGLPLEAVAELPGIVVHGPRGGGRAIGPEALPADALGGCAVLFRTGWSRHPGTPAFAEDAPFLAAETGEALVARGAALVGIDALGVDDLRDGRRPVHAALLRAGIPIVAQLAGLEALPAAGFRVTAVPVRVRGLGAFPVRAFARLP